MTDIATLARQPMYSTLANRRLDPIIEKFVTQIPQRVTAIETAASAGDWVSLERLAHQLKGAAGSYGFGQVTPLAADLEIAARKRQSGEQAPLFLGELADLCLSMRSGRSPLDSASDE